MPGRQITLGGICPTGETHLVAYVHRGPSNSMLILWVIEHTPILSQGAQQQPEPPG